MAGEGLYLVGCPWTGLPRLREELVGLVPDARILSVVEIEAVTPRSLSTNSGRQWNIDDVNACFLRYPYDLIPPFTATYAAREAIEWFKTLCLLLSDYNVNDASRAWALRNRLFSLRALHQHGVAIPDSVMTSLPRESCSAGPKDRDRLVAKSIGNCFVADTDDQYPSDLFVVEEDDGDHAVIFPTQRVTRQGLDLYIKHSDRVFLQRMIEGHAEYRCYCAGGRWSFYLRQESDQLDKSGCAYLTTEWTIQRDLKSKILRMMQEYRQGYACLDIVDTMEGPVVLDYNPYGTLPAYGEHPDTTRDLAMTICALGESR